MNEIKEGSLTFKFLTSSICTKYDEWIFYRNQLSKSSNGLKGVDILLIESNTTWLIEVKDYRIHQREKPTDLGLEIAFKIRDTLAGLTAARLNATDQNEKDIADKALKTEKIRVVLHLEQPNHISRLKPQIIAPADMVDKLKQLLKPFDAHPIVIDKKMSSRKVSWEVA